MIDELISKIREARLRGFFTEDDSRSFTKVSEELGAQWGLLDQLNIAITDRNEPLIKVLKAKIEGYIETGEVPDVKLVEEVEPEPFMLMAAFMLPTSNLSNMQYNALAASYPDYKVGVLYKVGTQFKYNGLLYEVIQEHTTQADWKPNELPALYKKIVSKGQIPEWQKPTGSHDAYQKGDRVKYKDKIYESTIDGNVYSPDEYEQGWKEVTQ